MLMTAFLVAFLGWLRCSEYTSRCRNTFSPDTSLLRSDISIRNNIIYLYIKASKTDTFRKGYTIRIAKTNSATLCPVSFMRRLLHDHPQPSGPLFTFHNGTYLTRAYLSDLLQLCFPELNLNTHSFRIGGASTAASIGLPDSAIRLLGRCLESSVFQSNIKSLFSCANVSKFQNSRIQVTCAFLSDKGPLYEEIL